MEIQEFIVNQQLTEDIQLATNIALIVLSVIIFAKLRYMVPYTRSIWEILCKLQDLVIIFHAVKKAEDQGYLSEGKKIALKTAVGTFILYKDENDEKMLLINGQVVSFKQVFADIECIRNMISDLKKTMYENRNNLLFSRFMRKKLKKIEHNLA